MTKEGTVIKGQGKYEKWDILPTANIRQSTPMLPIGSYVGECYLEEDKLGNSYITVYTTAPDIIETYISGFNESLYGKRITLKNIKKLKYSDVRYYMDSIIEKLIER